MGYMFDSKKLDMHVGDSDAAADFHHELAENIIKSLKDHEKKHDNCFNTDGILNVAMILDENFANKSWRFTPMTKYIEEFLERYKKWIAKKAKISDEDWAGAKNKKEHLAVFRKIHKRLLAKLYRMGE